jgi:formylmethanofuran dehydrogenase subunit E
MDQAKLPADLQRAIEFHGHLCPGLMIGWRAARAASRRLGLGRAEDEELVAEVENDSCSVDALQSMLSTTFGKGNLLFYDHGKQVFTVTDRNRGRAVRVAFVAEDAKPRLADGSTDREAFMQTLLEAPEERLFKVEEVEARPPGEAVIEPSLRCARCGEPTQRSKTVEVGGQKLCRPCAREVAP